MSKQQILLGSILLIIGIIGVLSILTMNIPLPPEAEAVLREQFTSQQIKFLTLVNPTIMLIMAVVLGTVFYKNLNFKLPIIERLVGIKNNKINLPNLLIYGISGGILSGAIITVIAFVFNPILPEEFLAISKSFEPSLAGRFLYGGITEEILMRFGLMTFLVWLCSLIFKGTKPVIYWIGIALSSLLFAVGHFPTLFAAIETPSSLMLIYILVANTIGGVIFGWLYWKKGLEAAFIAHVFTHVILILAEPILN
jgi:membrane protease YdiL (CAAX protease family)